MLDEVEEGRLRPLEVVDDHDERAPLGERLEQPSRRPEDLLRGVAAGAAEPDRLGEHVGDQVRLRVVRQLVHDGIPDLDTGGGAGQVAHELGQRPVGDALAVGEAAATQHGRALAEAGA